MDNFGKVVDFFTERLSQLVESNLIDVAERKGRFLQLDIDARKTDWSSLIEESKTNPDTFRDLKLYCGEAINRGEKLDPLLEVWLSNLLKELIDEPPKKKGARKISFGRDYFLWLLIDTASKEFNFTVSRNQEGKKTSICDALSIAINKINKDTEKSNRIKPTSFNELRQLYHRSNKIFTNSFQLSQKSSVE